MNSLMTRKQSYKLRKLGKFNYSLTIPSTIVEYLGGYSDDAELFFNCENGNLIVSTSPSLQQKPQGWTAEVNTLIPFIRKDKYILGYDSLYKSYFMYDSCQIQYGSLDDCLRYLQAIHIQVPKVMITALKKYIGETFN